MSLRVRTVLATAAVVALPLTPAHAGLVPLGPAWAQTIVSVDPVAEGAVCTFAGIVDPTAEPNTVAGVLAAGPLVVLGGGTLSCRVQVDVATYGAVSPEVVAVDDLVPFDLSQVSFNAVPTAHVYLCAKLVLADTAGTTYYWNATLNQWDASATAPCALASEVVLP